MFCPASSSSYDTQSLGGHSNLSVPNGNMSASSSTSDIRSAKVGPEADDPPLWKRSPARRHMSLGHFNEFGQYVSELGLDNMPNLDKKKGMPSTVGQAYTCACIVRSSKSAFCVIRQ